MAASVDQKQSARAGCIIYKISFIYSMEHSQVGALGKKKKKNLKIIVLWPGFEPHWSGQGPTSPAVALTNSLLHGQRGLVGNRQVLAQSAVQLLIIKNNLWKSRSNIYSAGLWSRDYLQSSIFIPGSIKMSLLIVYGDSLRILAFLWEHSISPQI